MDTLKEGDTCRFCGGTHPYHWTACRNAVKGKRISDPHEAPKEESKEAL